MCSNFDLFEVTVGAVPEGGGDDVSCVHADPRRGPRTPRGQVNSALRTRIWRGPRLLKILKHKYLMFFYVLRMRVLPQNAVMEVTLPLQIEFFKFQKVFSE